MMRRDRKILDLKFHELPAYRRKMIESATRNLMEYMNVVEHPNAKIIEERIREALSDRK